MYNFKIARTIDQLRLFVALLAAAALASAAAGPPPGNVRVEVRDIKGAAVSDAVASLTALDRPSPCLPPGQTVEIVQEGEEFRPYVSAVAVGTRVRFPNRDTVQHHVYSLSQAKKFDLPLYLGEPKESVLFEQPGVVSLGCNIHDWMSAYVVVLATPHFAKSDDDGSVNLTGLPAGRYRLEVWHPRIKTVFQRELAIDPDDVATQVIVVTLGVDRRIRRATESAGSGYR